MTSRTQRASARVELFVALLLAAAAVATCAGCAPGTNSHAATMQPNSTASSTTQTVDEAFQTRAETACNPYSTFNDKHPFPWREFDPYRPTASLLPKIGAFFDRNPANHTLYATLRKLGSPLSGEAAWNRILSDIRTFQIDGETQIAAARRGDARTFTASVATNQHDLAQAQIDFESAGFDQTRPCMKIFTG